MPALEFPRPLLTPLHELGARMLDSRRAGTAHESLARELLAAFYDLSMRNGSDLVLHELESTFSGLDISDRTTFYSDAKVVGAVAAQLRAVDLDGGGPRNAKPRMLADALIAALGLTLADPTDQTLSLDDTVRIEVLAALTGAINNELVAPQVRETIIANGRERCEPRFHVAYDKMAAHLDDRGMRLVKQLKLPIDAVQAVQQVLTATRAALIERVSRTAIDRAIEVIGRANPEAAARIDRPVSFKLTPREVAVLRATEPTVPMMPAVIVDSLLASLTETAHLAWRAPERPVRTYSATATFAVGDLLEHPKFGRGSVISCVAQRIEVEFDDGPHTLVHVRK